MFISKETNKLRLISKVARLYYEQDLPQKQIADQLPQTESVHNLVRDLSKKQRQQLFSILNILRDRALEDLATAYKPPFP